MKKQILRDLYEVSGHLNGVLSAGGVGNLSNIQDVDDFIGVKPGDLFSLDTGLFGIDLSLENDSSLDRSNGHLVHSDLFLTTAVAPSTEVIPASAAAAIFSVLPKSLAYTTSTWVMVCSLVFECVFIW